MDKTFGKLSVILVFILPAFIMFTLIVIVSIFWIFGISFFNWNGLSAPSFTGLENYIQLLFHDRNFWLITGNTFLYTFYELILQIGGGLLVAFFLTRITVFRAGLQTLYYIPVIISTVAICQIFNKMLSVTPPGIIDSLLGFINPNMQQFEWISNPKASLPVAAFVEGYKYLGLYMVIFYAALIGIPKEIMEAGTLDGAGLWTQFVKIQVPYIKPVIYSNFILVLNGSMRSFDISYLLTKGGPGNSSQLLAPYMYKQAFSSLKYGYGSTISIVIVILCVGMGFLFQHMMAKGEKD
jgi:raffinose/stachyose/melibiose transport system permease protein